MIETLRSNPQTTLLIAAAIGFVVYYFRAQIAALFDSAQTTIADAVDSKPDHADDDEAEAIANLRALLRLIDYAEASGAEALTDAMDQVKAHYFDRPDKAEAPA